MATRTIANAGGNWSSTGTWVEGQVPTASDDVVATGTSGALVLDATGNCQSIDFTNYTSTFTQNANIDLNIGSASGGAFKTVAGMTLVNLGGGHFNFVSTSNNGGAGWPITTGGKLMGHCVFNGVGSKWTLQDTFTATGSTQQTTLTNGTLDTNGQTVTWGAFVSSNSNVRTISLGSSSLTLNVTSGTAWAVTTSTNLTVNAGTSTITCSGSTSTFQAGSTALTYNNVAFTGASRATLTSGIANQVYNNITRTGTAATTDEFSIGSNITVNGTFTVTGNSVVNRMLLDNSTVAAARTITVGTGFSLSNVDFQDITAAGTAGTWTGTSMGDCGGNSNITFDAPVAQTWSGTGGGNWSANAWTTRIPLPQDNVFFTSAFGTVSITMNMPRVGKNIDWTGATGAVTWARGSGVTTTNYGNLTLSSAVATFGLSSGTHTLSGRSSHTYISNGVVATTPLQFGGFGLGTYTLQDALTAPNSVAVQGCTFNTNNQTITTSSFSSAGTNTINMGSTTLTMNLSTGGSIWSLGASTTFNAGTSQINVSDTGNFAISFIGSSRTYNNVTFNNTGHGTINVTGANTFNTLTLSAGRSITFPSSTTNTVTGFAATGSPNAYVYLPGINTTTSISTPDSAALSITGALTIDAKVALDNWTPPLNPNACAFFGKWGSAAGFNSYLFRIDNSGRGVFTASQDGTASTLNTNCDTAFGFTNGTTNWVRMTFTPNSASGLKFWKSSDGSSWTQVGSTISTVAIASIFDSSTACEIGSYTTQNNLTGKYFQSKVYNSDLGSGSGTPVFFANFETKAFGANSFAESSTNAATVTLNGSALQAGDGRVLINSSTPGTQALLAKATGVVSCDYLTIQDSSADAGAAWYAGPHSVSISNNSGWIFTGLSQDAKFFGMFD